MTIQTNPHSKGFFNHAGLTLAYDAVKYTNIDSYQKNTLENIGGTLMWHITELPKKIHTLINEPRFLVVVFTVIGMYSVQFAFYPSSTIELTKQVIKFIGIRYIKHIKEVAYAALMSGTVGWGLRAYGRVSNSDLMSKWYSQVSPKQPEQNANRAS